MTVGDLKNLLENLPDDTPVLVTGHDHTLREAFVFPSEAVHDEGARSYYEDYGAILMAWEQRVKALVIT